ncbi:MAG: class I SAM-dependent methyltransferase [Akkermansiaceae bacterium]
MSTDQNHTYPQIAQDATLRLESFLSQRIRDNGDISFFEYMHHALYHPQWGYYTRGAQNVGKAGDFFTSVSVGSCFGTILAHRIHQLWQENNSPQTYHLIEMGANNGQLALDILNTIQQTFPPLYTNLHYHIIEHLDTIQKTQAQTLTDHKEKISLHTSPSQISEKNGIILSNELIDAFPVHLLQLENNTWNQQNITITNDKLTFTLSQKLTPNIGLENFTKTLPPVTTLPDHYQTEYRPGLDTHIAETSQMLENFNTITIDYGHTTSSYYAASRSTGTLRCYHQHQADEAPLLLPGLKDITAHVDFSQLAKTYLQHHQHLTHFSSQSHYLTTHAKNWLLSIEENLTPENFKLIRQFQTLTHPTTMGHQFHILETSSTGKSDPDTLEKLELK